jgi:hypothetical protein
MRNPNFSQANKSYQIRLISHTITMNENPVETCHGTSLHCVHSNGFDITGGKGREVGDAGDVGEVFSPSSPSSPPSPSSSMPVGEKSGVSPISAECGLQLSTQH